MIISIASGKGGTGKTTVATNMALAVDNTQLIDCDVEEPNAHIFIKPQFNKKLPVHIPIPKVDREKCSYCGKCSGICNYNAIAIAQNNFYLYSELCHGCGACSHLCPENALTEINKTIGHIELGQSGNLEFAHGLMNIGEVLATPIIRSLKKYINTEKIVIIDSPPGTTCPMIEAVKDSNYTILVTEPTPFGLHDLILAIAATKKLKIPCGVIINRADIGNNDIKQYCAQNNIPILLEIPYSKEIATAYSKGIPLINRLPEYKERLQKLIKNIIAKYGQQQ